MNETAPFNLKFEDPRLNMTLPGRVMVRILMAVFFFAFIAAVVVLLVSDVTWLRSLGAFLALILLHRFFRRGRGDLPISRAVRMQDINIVLVMCPSALAIIERAYDKAKLSRSRVEHELLLELLRRKEIAEIFPRLDISFKEFRNKLDALLLEESSESKDVFLPILKDAFYSAFRGGREYIGSLDLFAAVIMGEDPVMARLRDTFTLRKEDVELALILGEQKRSSWFSRLPNAVGGLLFESHKAPRHRIMNRAWTARPTPVLDRYSRDMTDLAREGEGGFMIGHDQEYNHLVEILARPLNPNALLVGDVGIGKETIIAHLARDLVKDKLPPALFDKRLVLLDLTSLVAGASQEELQAKLQAIVVEIKSAGNIILGIPDIHNLLKTSGTAYLSAADALMPIIMENAFPIIGTSYPKEFAESIEGRSDFVGMFEIIRVQEINEEEARRLLAYEAMIMEESARVTISLGAISASVRLAKKYFHTKHLPASAEELLKSALVLAQSKGVRVVGEETVIRAAEEKTNIPIHEVGKEETSKLLNLESIIHERFIDQEEAVRVVSQALREYRSGLSRPGGPIASFLFVGPTGVGKTELAKLVAEIQFGSQAMMARFDMTEYQDKASYARFIGSADGSVRGALTDAVRQKPYSLILLDEFEKAYPDILNLFLQVLDDGRLTSGMGEVVDFQNTIIIATSNAHSDIINESLRQGQTMDSIADYLKKKLVDVFKPELLNRFTKTVVFKNLSLKDVEAVTVLNVRSVSDTLKEQGIDLSFDQAAIALIAKIGYDPAFGARPIRRAIEERVRAVLAEKILKKEIVRGGKVVASATGDELTFTQP